MPQRVTFRSHSPHMTRLSELRHRKWSTTSPAWLVLAWLASGSACVEAPAPVWHDEAGHRWRELRVSGGQPGFTSIGSSRTGIRFQNQVSDSALLSNRYLAQGAGVALGDVDGDGLVDVFLGRTEGSNALYRNRGGWRFEDITVEAGVAAADRFTTGAAFADVDGDADLDLVLLALTGPNALFLNDGTGRFSEQRSEAGFDPLPRGSTTPALADVDGDGDLDLYIANYKPVSVADVIPPQRRAFDQVVSQVTPGRFEVTGAYREHFKLVSPPGMGGTYMTIRAEPDQFYLNEGGRFALVPWPAARFRDTAGGPAPADESFGLDARFADLNGDRAPELYVANDFEDPDRFWINDGRGGFRLADWTVQRQTSNSGMGVDVGDVNADGLPDLFEVDMLSRDTRRIKTQMPTHTATAKQPGMPQLQLQQQRNTLFLNRGDGSFGEIAAFAGVQASGWSWSTMFLDVDLDGWQDLLVTAGHLWDVMDADTQERLQNRLSDVAWQRERWEYPALALPNVAWRNRGDLTFEDVSRAWRFGTEPGMSHAMAAGDLDGDGDLDVVINRLGAPALLLRNDTPAARIGIKLRGPAPNTQAVGARIRVMGDGLPLQDREVGAGGLYLSHSDYQASFATGTADSVRIEVTWRDGRRTMLPAARPNRLYQISAETATAAPADSTPIVPPLFEDISSQLAAWQHTDPVYDDWERQFLLPNALSLLGPGVTWFDLDRDGDEDLLVGSGSGGRLGVFRNQRGRLTPDPNSGPSAPVDLGTVLGLMDRTGRRLLLAQSNWEARSPQEALSVPAVAGVSVASGRVGLSSEAILAPRPSSSGPMAAADYDRDGDLDLLVGGRAIPGLYPEAASSTLLHHAGGRLTVDSVNTAALNQVGLVSAALFTDIDADGDADLVLAREWNSILLLVNAAGRFTAAPASWGLERWTSRWIGLASGDLDGDGRIDLVATSWGRNTMVQPDSARPLTLVFGPFGLRGKMEMLLAQTDPRIAGLAPHNSFQRVRMTLPDLVSRIRNFDAYAEATVDQVLGPMRDRTTQVTAVTLDHTVFLNRGDRFEPVALPAEAQFAPAFGSVISDFDGDGREDLFLAQNFYPTATGLPRYDSGRGLLLTGDGKGGFTPLPAQRSGVVIYGDQRGAAASDLDGDGRIDLAVAQNSGRVRLFRNQSARPGLRVRLIGPPDNPEGIGARLRVEYGSGLGPVREVQSGSGYWSQNGAVQVMGLAEKPVAVQVRWPDGNESRAEVRAGAREIVVRR